MTRKYTPGKWYLDVTLTFEGDDYKIREVTDAKGVADCMLWADIAPSPYGDGDYVFVGVYLENNFTDDMVKLEGKREAEAIAILKANDKWSDWADQEARSMMGEAA